jgi:hypothetical protein
LESSQQRWWSTLQDNERKLPPQVGCIVDANIASSTAKRAEHRKRFTAEEQAVMQRRWSHRANPKCRRRTALHSDCSPLAQDGLGQSLN